jgi:ribosomal protein L44E
MNTTIATREEWLNQAKDGMIETLFKQAGMEDTAQKTKIRVTCAPCSYRSDSKTLGWCFSDKNSGDGHHELIISSKIDDGSRAMDILAHEITHAVVGLEAGHGPKFRALATKIGLEGKMTATMASEEFKKVASKIIEKIGVYPHAEFTIGSKKKQTTRMVKLECEDCGFIARASRTALSKAGNPTCGCGGYMYTDD